MNRDMRIAHLILQGYVPSANVLGWVAIWNGETGRMCRFFDDGMDGPGWDVRGPIVSTLALIGHSEVPWHRISDEELAQLTAEKIPPKYRHGMAGIKRAFARMDELGTNTLGPGDL